MIPLSVLLSLLPSSFNPSLCLPCSSSLNCNKLFISLGWFINHIFSFSLCACLCVSSQVINHTVSLYTMPCALFFFYYPHCVCLLSTFNLSHCGHNSLLNMETWLLISISMLMVNPIESIFSIKLTNWPIVNWCKTVKKFLIWFMWYIFWIYCYIWGSSRSTGRGVIYEPQGQRFDSWFLMAIRQGVLELAKTTCTVWQLSNNKGVK